MSNDVYWIYAMKVRNGASDDFEALVREIVAKTEKEEGAISYHISKADDGRTVHVFEHYRDSAAVVAHVTQTFEPVADRMESLAETTGVTVYGAPVGRAREITDSWGAVYMEPMAGFILRS